MAVSWDAALCSLAISLLTEAVSTSEMSVSVYRLHGAIWQKTAMFRLLVVRTWNLTKRYLIRYEAGTSIRSPTVTQVFKKCPFTQADCSTPCSKNLAMELCHGPGKCSSHTMCHRSLPVASEHTLASERVTSIEILNQNFVISLISLSILSLLM